MARKANTGQEMMAVEGTDQDEGVVTTVDAQGDYEEAPKPGTPELKSNATQTPDVYKEKENYNTYKSKYLQKLSECKNLRRQVKRLRGRNLLAKKVLHS